MFKFRNKSIVSSAFFILTLLLSSYSHGSETKLHKLLKSQGQDNACKHILSLFEKQAHSRLSQWFSRNPKKVLSELDSEGVSPLGLAIKNNQNLVARVLLEKLDINESTILQEGLVDLAITAENLEIIDALKNRVANLNFKNALGMTPLIFASFQGKFEVVKLLLQHGVDVDQEYSNGSKALAFAALYGNLEVVKDLLNAGLDINHVNKEGYSALYYSLSLDNIQDEGILHKKIAVAEFLLDQGAKTPPDLAKLILWAAQTNRTSLAAKLLTQGLDPNCKNSKGLTPLMAASKEGNLELLKLLLHHGAEPDLEDTNGSRPLAFAAQSGHLAIAKELLSAGVDINHANKEGQTALFLALSRHTRIDTEILQRKTACAEFLLDYGAKVSPDFAKDILWAAQTNQTSLAQKLLMRGLDPNYQSLFGLTPLMAASQRGHLESVRLLLDYGASLEMLSLNGSNALSFAADQEQEEVAQLLIEKGANINSLSKVLRLKLFLGSRNLENLKSLILQGECASPVDTNGNTCLHMAAVMGKFDAIRILLDGNLDPKIKNKAGNTPLESARIKGNAVGIHSLFYYPKIQALSDAKQFSVLKSNLLTDLKDAKVKNNAVEADILETLKIFLNEKGKKIYYREKENELEQTTYSGNHRTKVIPFDENCCLICGNDLPNSVKGTLCGPAACSCPFCSECSERFAEAIIASGGAELSTCPQCKEPTKPSFLRKVKLSHSDFTQALALQIQALDRTSTGYLPCPGIDCSGGMVINPDETSRYTCFLCDFNGCLKCGEDHTGSCEKVDEDKKIEMEAFLTEALRANALARDCYYCGKIVIKEGGCNDIKCPECGKKYHWNYGDHLKHPKFAEWKTEHNEVHDDRLEEKQYETLGHPHY